MLRRSPLPGLPGFPGLPGLGLLAAIALGTSSGCGGSDDTATDAGAGGTAGGGATGEGGATGGSTGGAPSTAIPPIEPDTQPTTPAHARAYDLMVALVDEEDFDVPALGDPALFAGSPATEPSAPGVLASLYFETAGLNADVQATRDTRQGIEADPERGKAIGQRFVQSLTLGAASEGSPEARGGAHFMGWRAVRALDAYLLLRAFDGFDERSGAGFDRAVGLLFDADGTPHGLGRRIAQADAACGTDALVSLKTALLDVRDPFATALEEKGEYDPLDRKVIGIGDSPAYDAFLLQVDTRLHQGLALAFLAGLKADETTPLAQAQALSTYEILSPKVFAQNPEGDAYIGQQLDQSLASEIDLAGIDDEPGVRALIGAAFGVVCAP
jgi:hypothetical protein